MSEVPAQASVSATTLTEAFEGACRRRADRPAISSGGETTIYSELHAAANSLAAGYRSLGIKRGDRTICQLPNCAEHVVALGAASRYLRSPLRRPDYCELRCRRP